MSDYVAMAKTALRRIEQCATDMEPIARRDREAWRDFGLALLEQRKVIPSHKKFGQWVRDHGLDVGPAASFQTRSDAIWLADHWTVIDSVDIKNNHPSRVRQECRAAGYPWAVTQGKRREKNAADAKNQPSVKDLLAQIKALTAERDKMIRDFHEAVNTRVEEKTAAELDRYRELTAKLEDELEVQRQKSSKIDSFITLQEWKSVLGCLHPDKPARSVEELTHAFQIFMKTKDGVSPKQDLGTLRARGWAEMHRDFKRAQAQRAQRAEARRAKQSAGKTAGGGPVGH